MVWFRASPAAMGAKGRRSPQRCGSRSQRIHVGRSGCGLTLPPKLSGSASANCAGPESSLDPNDDVRLRCERTARLVFALLERGADWGAQNHPPRASNFTERRPGRPGRLRFLWLFYFVAPRCNARGVRSRNGRLDEGEEGERDEDSRDRHRRYGAEGAHPRRGRRAADGARPGRDAAPCHAGGNSPRAPQLVATLGDFDRISVGFPGVVVDGVTKTAPNLHPKWTGFPLAKKLEHTLKKPVRVANDAGVQGFGDIEGRGVEMLLTLGTGMGCALFNDGRYVPNLELAHHPLRKGKTYEEYVGAKALGKRRQEEVEPPRSARCSRRSSRSGTRAKSISAAGMRSTSRSASRQT